MMVDAASIGRSVVSRDAVTLHVNYEISDTFRVKYEHIRLAGQSGHRRTGQAAS